MFKEVFNTIYISIEKLRMEEKVRPTFLNTQKQVAYFKNIVDEILYIQKSLNEIKEQLNKDKFPELYNNIENALIDLEEIFEKYKDEYIVKMYLNEIKNFGKKTTLFESIYDFERSLVIKPLVKVTAEFIQEIMVQADEYAKNAINYYFFTNNPYEIDETYGIVIPKKVECENSSTFITDLYNYLNNIYAIYKQQNETELIQLDLLERTIQEKLLEFNSIVTNADKNKFKPKDDTTAEEYISEIEKLLEPIENKKTEIINLGVYRFIILKKDFIKFEEKFKNLKNYYYTNPLFKSYQIDKKFNKKLKELQEIITLLEDGKLDISKNYILFNYNIKDIVNEIIEIAKENKKQIFYTEKYNSSGKSKKLVFEFYQTELFLNSIKVYYYDLITKHIYRKGQISIDDFGDSTINTIRSKYKIELAKYNDYIEQEVYFLNDLEIDDFINNVKKLQIVLKKTAMEFFDYALKTSPPTYYETIENSYKLFLDKLVTDLDELKIKKVNLVELNLNPNREEALQNIRTIRDFITEIEHILEISRKYVFINMTDFIQKNIYDLFKTFYTELKENFDKQEYIVVTEKFKQFYKNTVFDFNMYYSLKSLVETAENIFNRVTNISNIFIDEQITKIPVDEENEDLRFAEDLFENETYKVIRNNISSLLDTYYAYVISKRPNEKLFLINEKNIKKLYFDNQMIKINYIRFYDKIIKKNNLINSIDYSNLKKYDWFEKTINELNSFDYEKKLETLIVNQDRILSKLSKMIIEYSADSNFITDISSDRILIIDEYNGTIKDKIKDYSELIQKIINMVEYEKLTKIKEKKLITHQNAWLEFVFNNRINEPEKFAYSDLDIFKGNIPYKVEFNAKVENLNTDENIDKENIEFIWDFNGDVLKGESVSYVFYEEGKYKVKCEAKYPSGEIKTKYIEFDLSGPTNSQLVKSDIIKYAPIKEIENQPKLTYFDEEAKKQITVPINIKNNLIDLISDQGSVELTAGDGELLVNNIGLVILGFEGKGFAGEKFDQTQIFSPDFKLPEIDEAEFLFDFKVSDPIMNKSIIDISTSKFIEYIAKVPSSEVISPYQIFDARKFQAADNILEIIPNDIVIMKNKMGRFMVVQILNIQEITEPDENKFYFQIDFKFFVNISLNEFDRYVFKPKETSLVVPTLIFDESNKEIFNTLISKLEKINLLENKKNETTDKEEIIKIENEIELLKNENRNHLIMKELNKLKTKIDLMKSKFQKMSDFDFNFENTDSKTIKQINEKLFEALNYTKTFSEYINNIHVYEFRKSIIDFEILISLYKEQYTVMNILIDTLIYFKKQDITYFIEQLKKLKYYPNKDSYELEETVFIKQLIQFIKDMREYLYKIKLIINLPILIKGQYIKFDRIYYRPTFDNENKIYEEIPELDLYLLNKKLELKFGYENEKVESGVDYTEINEIISINIKDILGSCLSNDDKKELGNYIQVIEERIIKEYDKFFMLPYWIDYLENLT